MFLFVFFKIEERYVEHTIITVLIILWKDNEQLYEIKLGFCIIVDDACFQKGTNNILGAKFSRTYHSTKKVFSNYYKFQKC